jgi:hypothetical protein
MERSFVPEEKEVRKGSMFLDTAHSNHLKCFICQIRKVRLYNVKPKTVAFAFKYFEMVIRTHARLCGRHFKVGGDEDDIRESEYDKIPSSRKYYTNEQVKMLRTLSQFVSFSKTETIFEPFKNLESLNEAHCKLITSWTKEEFIRFSSFLTSWKKSEGRDKNEIIALYRYYMKNGLTQATIAILRGNTTQRQVSRYLEQMRICIYDDFVPFFLGIINRSRDFFLQHQTPTCKMIFNLEDDVLVINADG